MPSFFELTPDYQLELAKRQIFHLVKQLFKKFCFVSVWIRLLLNILTLPVNWISRQNIILEKVEYVIVNLLPLAHTAFGQRAFFFFNITTAARGHETGRSGWGLVVWGLFCARCSELGPPAPGCLPGMGQGRATGGWGCPALSPPLGYSGSYSCWLWSCLFVIQDPLLY